MPPNLSINFSTSRGLASLDFDIHILPIPYPKKHNTLNTTYMTIESHKRTLAIIHLTVGFLKIFVLGCISLFFTSFKPFIENKIIDLNGAEAAWIIELVSSVFFSIMVIAIVLSAISIIGGFATLNNKSYGMVLLVIAGCISILSFPVGTAIGAYSIFVFVENQRAETSQAKANQDSSE